MIYVNRTKRYLDLYYNSRMYATVNVERVKYKVGNIHVDVKNFNHLIWKQALKEQKQIIQYIKEMGFETLMAAQEHPDELWMRFCKIFGFETELTLLFREIK